jgi:hypothetical protein
VIKTLKKQADFDTWVKEVTETWKHIDSLKGKQAKRNLGVLRIILEAPDEGISMWDIALEYLKLTQSNFNSWSRDTVFHERQKENAQMSRRLKFLVNKKYIIKMGTRYTLSIKGVYSLYFFDPKLSIEKGLGDYKNDPMFAKDPEFLETLTFYTNPDRAAAFSTFVKRRLLKYKINLDDISPEALVDFIELDKKSKDLSLTE